MATMRNRRLDPKLPAKTLVLWALVTAASFAGLPAALAASEAFCDFPGRFDRWLDFRFAGHRYSMPAAYTAFGNPTHGQEVSGVLFYALASDFGHLESPEYYRRNRVDGIIKIPDNVRFIFHGGAPPAKIAEVSANFGAGVSDPKNFRPLTSFPRRSAEMGLIEIVYEVGRVYKQNTFVFKHNGKIEATLVCAIDQSVPFPQCMSDMQYKGQNIGFGFARSNFHKWAFYRSRVEAFVDCGRARGQVLQNRKLRR